MNDIVTAPKISASLAAHIHPGAKVQLSESVAMLLREQIISGKLKKGDFLRIDSIATEFGVSSTPVREGLLLLLNEAFVKLIPRRGFIVTGFSKDDLRDLFWTQATIGAELTARATTRMTDEDIQELQHFHQEHGRAVAAGDQSEATALGHAFHRKINLAANSPRLAQILGSLTKQLPNRFYASIEGQLKGSVEYHTMIVDAIRMRDPDSARALMFRHIFTAVEHLIASLDDNQS